MDASSVVNSSLHFTASPEARTPEISPRNFGSRTSPSNGVFSSTGCLRPRAFDSAWLRVGLALDRTNFTVDNQDRAKGLYYVRFSDSMQELKKEGLLGKLFAGSAPKPTREFMVNVRPKADTVTQIAVVDANGQVDTSTDAQRIVALLHAQLN